MTRDSASAQRYVLISVLALLLISAYRGRLTSDRGGEGFFKRLWGVGWLSVFLGVLADVAPTVAGPFAVLVVLGSLTHGGDAAIGNLLGKMGRNGPSQGATGGASHPAGPLGPQGNPNAGGGGASHPAGPLGPQGNPNAGGGGASHPAGPIGPKR